MLLIPNKEDITTRKCPICLKNLNKEHYLKENRNEDININLCWNLKILAIPCCLCRDILLDFIETLNNDKLIEISQENHKIKIIFWFERINNIGYFKFSIEMLKRIVSYGIIENKLINQYCYSFF